MSVLFLQAFVRLANQKTKQEIFFVAEPEPSKVFKFDLVSGISVQFLIVFLQLLCENFAPDHLRIICLNQQKGSLKERYRNVWRIKILN